MMKQLMIIPALALCLMASTSARADGTVQEFDSADTSATEKSCEPALATITYTASAGYQYKYDTKQFNKVYADAVRQAAASGQRAPTADQVQKTLEGYSNTKLQKEFPGGVPKNWSITDDCRVIPVPACFIIIVIK